MSHRVVTSEMRPYTTKRCNTPHFHVGIYIYTMFHAMVINDRIIPNEEEDRRFVGGTLLAALDICLIN